MLLRYKVPQNIDMEDRIIGPLTMIQFIYAVVGGGFCYTIFMSLPSPLSLVLVIPIALFTLATIFLKVNERPFLHFLTSVIQFASAPKQRIWQHENSDLTVEIYRANTQVKQAYQAKTFSREDIQNAAQQMDKTRFH